MEYFLIYIVALALVGLVLGSFAGATVWRLRARQLVEDKAAGEEYDRGELKQLKKLTKKSFATDHSQCLHCGYQLKWYDLIPLVSWISLGGKCRNCRKPIGYFEPIIELCVALFFVLSYLWWPYALVTPLDISRLIVWLVAGVGLAMLFAYDLKWYLLPDKINFTVLGLGIVTAIIVLLHGGDIATQGLNILGSALILGGLYLFLWLISKGEWIGFGDVKLGLGLGLLLSDWQLAFIGLFAANVIGCLIVIPGMALKKLDRKSRVPFGPLLILGTLVALFLGNHLISLYTNSLF